MDLIHRYTYQMASVFGFCQVKKADQMQPNILASRFHVKGLIKLYYV